MAYDRRVKASPQLSSETAAGVEQVRSWIDLLCGEIGPRRPTSQGERVAAETMRSELRRLGIQAETKAYRGYASFGQPYGVMLLAATAPGLLPRRRRRLRSSIAFAAAAALVLEGDLRITPLSRLLARREGRSLLATLEPEGEVQRTLCLVSHLDTSRSGLLFHPVLAPLLGRWITLQSIAVLAGAAEPLLSRSRAGRRILGMSRAIAAVGLSLLAERELRGEDVQGANDNASGVAVSAGLFSERAEQRLESTRLVLLATGGEEAGLLGMQAFLRAHDTTGWLFLNFDGVGAPATLRFLEREGVFVRKPADPGLLRVVRRLARDRPELGLEPQRTPAGLSYDTTAVLARGGRGLTLSSQDETIPHLHCPSDVPANLDLDSLAMALEAGRALIAAIDRGEADEPTQTT